jgi:hypothetical protein
MPLPEQTASEEFTERVGETGAGLLVMPQMVATDDYRRNQRAARKRVDEAHEMMKRALGMQDIGRSKEGDGVESGDEMGDMIYTGDISLHPGQSVRLGRHTVIQADATTDEADQPTTSNPADTKPVKSWWPSMLMAASLLAGGSGIGYVIHELLQHPSSPSAANDTDTDTITEFDFPKE